MARLHKLKEWATEVETGLFTSYDDAQAAMFKETAAALRIQKHWRGFKVGTLVVPPTYRTCKRECSTANTSEPTI